MAEIIGLRDLAPDEEVYTLDLNQWIGAFCAETGKYCKVKVNAKTGTRILFYALNGHHMPTIDGSIRRGRRTTQGKRVIVGASKSIVDTFVYTLSTDLDPRLRTPAAQAEAWIFNKLALLKKYGALFYDTTVWKKDRSDLKKLAAKKWGMPCEEDQIVFETNTNVLGAAILGLDGPFQFCVERRGGLWFGPSKILSIMPA